MTVIDPRRRDLAQIHIAKKDLALDDTTYRALLTRVAGVSSSKDLDGIGRGRVLAEFRRLGWANKPKGRKRAGARRPAQTMIAGKARALWLSLYQLAEIDDPSEQALAAFARRQTGLDDLAWITPAQGDSLIEALKKRCQRAGYAATDRAAREEIAGFDAIMPDQPDALARGYNTLLISTQWDKLVALGAFRHGVHARLDTWLHRHIKGGTTHPGWLGLIDQRRAIEKLGTWLRRVSAARSAGVSNATEGGPGGAAA